MRHNARILEKLCRNFYRIVKKLVGKDKEPEWKNRIRGKRRKIYR